MTLTKVAYAIREQTRKQTKKISLSKHFIIIFNQLI
jgi:hypothetical protein